MPHLSPMQWTMMLNFSMVLLLTTMIFTYSMNKNKMHIMVMNSTPKKSTWKWFQEQNKL